MNETELMIRPATGPTAVVPIDYAEKAMGSLMQLHGELMEEKERRVDLYRRLMEKEQTVAELRMYVKLLEDKLEKDKPVAVASEIAPPVAAAPPVAVAAQAPAPARAPPRPPPPPRPLTLVRAAPVVVPRPSPPGAEPPRPPPAPPPARTPARGFVAADGWKAW